MAAAPPTDPQARKTSFTARPAATTLKLDLYLPATLSAARRMGSPVVIYFHGGGWRVGNKDEAARFAKRSHGRRHRAGQRGLSVERRGDLAGADHRLQDGRALDARQCPPLRPGPRADRRRSERLPAAISSRCSARPCRRQKPWKTARQGSPKESSRVQAVCDVSGPVDLSHSDATRLIGKTRGPFGELRVGSAQEKPRPRTGQADPSRYVKGGEPPFLIIHGRRRTKLVRPRDTPASWKRR